VFSSHIVNIIFNQLNIKKYNFEENHKKTKTKKIMQRNTTTINNVLKKKITKLNLNQLNIKKIKSANIILKNKKIK